MMGEVGTGDIGALESTIQSLINTFKIVNALVGDEANHQNGESKTPKNIRCKNFNLFTTEKVLGLQESHDSAPRTRCMRSLDNL